MAQWLHDLLDLALPQHCLLCDNPSPQLICGDCRLDLPHLSGPCCQRCAHPLATATADKLCGPCRRNPPAVDETLAFFRYDAPIDTSIHALKFGHEVRLAKALADAGVELHQWRFAAESICSADAVMGIPLHQTRLCERGYNQAHEIARHLARRLRLPLISNACEREQATTAQSHLHGDERRRNVRYAFIAARPLAYRHIVLVDDVITSGSTMDACARALKAQGVLRVTAVALARAILRGA